MNQVKVDELCFVSVRIKRLAGRRNTALTLFRRPGAVPPFDPALLTASRDPYELVAVAESFMPEEAYRIVEHLEGGYQRLGGPVEIWRPWIGGTEGAMPYTWVPALPGAHKISFPRCPVPAMGYACTMTEVPNLASRRREPRRSMVPSEEADGAGPLLRWT